MAVPARKLVTGRRGQSLIEFALVLPLMLVVSLLITEFARALWIQNLLTLAAHNGVRAAIVDDSGDWMSAAEDSANRILRAVGIATDQGVNRTRFLASGTRAATGQVVLTVTLERDFRFIVQGPLPTNPRLDRSPIRPSPLTLRAVATMDAQPNFTGSVP